MKAYFLIILIVFLATVTYVTWHLYRLAPGGKGISLIVAGLFLLWMATAFAGMKSGALHDFGHTWMIAYLYLLIAFLVADIGVLLKLIPKGWMSANGYTLAALLGATAIVLVAGGIHYKHKYREELTIKTEKPLPRPLTVVLASDLHLGYGNRKPELARWIDFINAEKPDLVLFGGDIVDIQLKPLIEGNYAEELERIEAPVFTVLGNHEYIGREKDAEEFFRDAGITLLKDTVVQFGDISIIGRDDRSNHSRAALKDMAVPPGRFTILLDHQPFHLEEAEDSGIDFQFSGHTHRGQVWPFSWVTDAMYEKSWGHHTRGNTRYYVSSGLGIWGPKIRIGTRSEYLVLHICNTD